MSTTEVAATVQGVDTFINSVTSKIEASQASPGSTKSSVNTNDSGMADDEKSEQNVQPKQVEPASRRASRMSSSGNAVSPVLERLEQMIVSDEWVDREDPRGHPPLNRVKSREGQKLSELGRTLVTSASLKAYIDLLGNHHRQSIAAWLYGNTSSAFSQLFRFPETAVHCSQSEGNISHSIRNGIGHAVKLALHETYGGDYAAKGWKTFTEKGAPVVYISPALHIDVAAYLTSEFGISDVVVLPKLSGDLAEIEGRIDHHAFDKLLDEHVQEGKLPLMVVGVVGSTVLGQNDMISKILEIRQKKHKFWLHIVGQAIAALALREPTEVLVHVLSQVDSVTLPLAVWLGIPAAPVITLHRQPDGMKPTYREKLDTLPWWVATQYLTNKRITDMVENAYLLSKVMLKGLSTIAQIDIVGMDNAVEFASRVYKNQYTAPTVLIFKYKYNGVKNAVQILNSCQAKAESEREEGEEKQKAQNVADELEYSDSLNNWLGQGLLSECQQLGIHMIELGGNHGTAFRFCPLEHAAANASHIDHVQKFIKQLTEILKIVDSTVQARTNFEDIKDQFPSLVLLPIRKWAGVGAVCYIPSIVKETNPLEWNDKQKQQVSHLNLELVHSLRSIDSAFSSGESATYDVSCVKFGMLSDAKDLVDLVQMVSERGKEIENSQQYLDSLAELIRQGIEAANEDLRKENENRLQQEGVIRQLPLMGSLVNWFSPLAKDAHAIKGRSFDLKTGQIHSTDVLYTIRKEDGAKTVTEVETPQEPHAPIKGTDTEQATEAIPSDKEKEKSTPEEPSETDQSTPPEEKPAN